ncbi:hypothetical protein LINPERHAP1_LOCUS43864 [Linum perenne]
MATLNPRRRRQYHPLFSLRPLLARRNGQKKSLLPSPTMGEDKRSNEIGGTAWRRDGRVSTAAGRRHAKEDINPRRRRRRDSGSAKTTRRRCGGNVDAAGATARRRDGVKRRNKTQWRRRGTGVVMESAAKEEQKRRSSPKKDESTRVITLKIR